MNYVEYRLSDTVLIFSRRNEEEQLNRDCVIKKKEKHVSKIENKPERPTFLDNVSVNKNKRTLEDIPDRPTSESLEVKKHKAVLIFPPSERRY